METEHVRSKQQEEREAAAKPSQLFLPTLPRERRRKIVELHHQAATAISEAMHDYLRAGDRFTFEGFGFISLDELDPLQESGATIATFDLEPQRVAGLAIASPALTRYIARTSLRTTSTPSQLGSGPPLTRLETMIARHALMALMESLGAFYHDHMVGRLRVSIAEDAAAEPTRFVPVQAIVKLRFRLGAQASGVYLTIVAEPAFVHASPAAESKPEPSGSGVLLPGAVATALPVAAAIILGSWHLRIAELAELRVGGEFVMPDGDDAWLEVGGIRLGTVTVRFADKGLRISMRRGGGDVPSDN